jgi:hypothetical protein
VIKAYYEYENSSVSDQEQLKSAFAQGFETMQEHPFPDFLNPDLLPSEYVPSPLYYAFYDAEDSAKALLLNGRGILDVYCIQNGVPIQQQSFREEEEGSTARLLKSGIILAYIYEERAYKYYRFEDGGLRLQATLIGDYRTALIDKNGCKTYITVEDSQRLMGELAGDTFDSADLDWKPLAEYGK